MYDNDVIYPVINKLSKFPMADPLSKYLEGRGLSFSIAEKFGVGVIPRFNIQSKLSEEELDVIKKFELVRSRHPVSMVVPLKTDSGSVISFQVRGIGRKEFVHISTPYSKFYHPVFGVSEQQMKILKYKACVFVEGVFDLLAIHPVSPIPVVSGLTAGIPNAAIERMSSYLKHVFVLFDMDSAGRHGAESVYKKFSAEGVNVDILEYDAEDPNALLQNKVGLEKLISVLDAHEKILRALYMIDEEV